jgi:hypothetical protein
VIVPGWDEWQEGDVTVAERQRRIRERRANEPLSGAERTAAWRLRNKVFERDQYTCRYCGVDDYPREWLVLEHVDPTGPSDETNLVTACRSCNKLKADRTPEQAGMTLRPVSDGVTTRHAASPVTRHGDTSHRIPTPSPYNSTGRGTQVEGERALGERAGAQASGNADDGEAGLPDYDDPVTVACRLLPNGGRMLGNAEYRAAWDDLVKRYGQEWVLDEIPLAYNAMPLADRTKGWEFFKQTEMRLAERTRAEELAAEKAKQRADRRADQAHQREIRQATPEQREQAAYQRAAIRIGLSRGIPTPTDASEVREFVMKHEPGFSPEASAA